MIGEIFTYQGKQYQAVKETNKASCADCCFYYLWGLGDDCKDFLESIQPNRNKYLTHVCSICAKNKIQFKCLGEVKQDGKRFRRIRL